MWCSVEDYQRFKMERILDVMQLRVQAREKISPTDSCCPVGVEQLLSKTGLLKARSNRKAVIQQVLLEQYCQIISGYNLRVLGSRIDCSCFRWAIGRCIEGSYKERQVSRDGQFFLRSALSFWSIPVLWVTAAAKHEGVDGDHVCSNNAMQGM